MSDRKEIAEIIRIVLTAILALLAIYGYDVGVIQPRTQAEVVRQVDQVIRPAMPTLVAPGASPAQQP